MTMPLWFIYGADYIRAVALLIIALFVLGVVTRRIRFVKVELANVNQHGDHCTEYLLVLDWRGVHALDIAARARWAFHGRRRREQRGKAGV